MYLKSAAFGSIFSCQAYEKNVRWTFFELSNIFKKGRLSLFRMVTGGKYGKYQRSIE